MELQALVGQFATQMHTLHPGADGGGDRTAVQQCSLDTTRSARRDDFDALMKLQSIIGTRPRSRIAATTRRRFRRRDADAAAAAAAISYVHAANDFRFQFESQSNSL